MHTPKFLGIFNFLIIQAGNIKTTLPHFCTFLTSEICIHKYRKSEAYESKISS